MAWPRRPACRAPADISQSASPGLLFTSAAGHFSRRGTWPAARHDGPLRPGSRPGPRRRGTAALCAARPETGAFVAARPRGAPVGHPAPRRCNRIGAPSALLRARAPSIDIAPMGGSVWETTGTVTGPLSCWFARAGGSVLSGPTDRYTHRNMHWNTDRAGLNPRCGDSARPGPGGSGGADAGRQTDCPSFDWDTTGG